MRTFSIMLFAIGALVVTFWDDLKTWLFSGLAFLGLCSSCNKKAPSASGASAKITASGNQVGSLTATQQVASVSYDNSGATCEIFQNHTGSSPHLYANYEQNELVGTVIAATQPEFNAYGEWVDMQKVGTQLNDPSLSLWAYRMAYQYPVNVKLRTREGCNAYDDVRNSEKYSYQGRDIKLPNIAAISNYEDLNLVLNISADIKTSTNSYDTWAMEVQGHHPGLQYRINGGAWLNTEIRTVEEVIGRTFNHTFIPHFTSDKDFYIDFTKNGGTTIDRFKVVRNSAGGHFSVTSTFTRVRDGRVFVHTFQVDKFTPTTLSGIPYKTWGNWYDLGILTPGNYTYQLRGETGYIIDPSLFVMAR